MKGVGKRKYLLPGHIEKRLLRNRNPGRDLTMGIGGKGRPLVSSNLHEFGLRDLMVKRWYTNRKHPRTNKMWLCFNGVMQAGGGGMGGFVKPEHCLR